MNPTVALSPPKRAEIPFTGIPDDCDFCGRPMADESFFVDAELPGRNGQWGILCTVCATSHRIRPGWGRAQFYRRDQPTSPWTCQAGLPPPDVRQLELVFEIPQVVACKAHGEGAFPCG